jgi:S-adenosylmethionine decarboxylase
MFLNKTSSGKHMICDIFDINNNHLLNNKSLLSSLLKNICKKYDFEILKEVDYSFQPIGCSILFLLSESHMSIHTFPEKNHLSFDIYTCRQYNDNTQYIEIFNYLIYHLNASQESECKIIDRNFKK